MSQVLDVERGTIRIGLKAAAGIAFALVTAAIGGVTTLGAMATKAEQAVLAETLRDEVAQVHAIAARAAQKAEENGAYLDKLDQLHGRIEFLVEAQLEEARTDKRTRRAVDTAMRRVRARAKGKGEVDPIADLQL